MTNFEKWKEGLTPEDMAKYFMEHCIWDRCPLKVQGTPFFFGTCYCKKDPHENGCKADLLKWGAEEYNGD